MAPRITTIRHLGNETQGATTTQQVSESSIFWALLSIAINAMLQPSFSGYLCSGGTFDGLLWPSRSSPTLCIVDAIAECWIMFDKYRKPGCTRPSAAGPIDVTIRLAIFLLTVVPRAIKLFCTSGVMVAQLVAAAFLVPSLVSMMRGLCEETPLEEISDLVDGLSPLNSGRITGLVVLFGWIPHVIIIYCVWYHIAGDAQVSTGANLSALIQWADVILVFICATYMVQHMLFAAVRWRSPIPQLPVLVILVMTGNLGISPLMHEPGGGHISRSQWMLAPALAFDVFLAGWIMAIACAFFVKRLLRIFQPARARSSLDEESRQSEISPEARDRSLTANHANGTTESNCHGEDSRTHSASNDEVALQDQVARQAKTTSQVPLGTQLPATLEKAQIASSSRSATMMEAAASNSSSTNKSNVATALNSLDGTARDQAKPSARPDRRSRSQPPLLYRGSEGASKPSTKPHQNASNVIWRASKSAVYWIVVIFARLVWSCTSQYGHACGWIDSKVTSRPHDSLIAFSVGNFITAMVYYMIYFDPTSSAAPNWTSVLG